MHTMYIFKHPYSMIHTLEYNTPCVIPTSSHTVTHLKHYTIYHASQLSQNTEHKSHCVKPTSYHKTLCVKHTCNTLHLVLHLPVKHNTLNVISTLWHICHNPYDKIQSVSYLPCITKNPVPYLTILPVSHTVTYHIKGYTCVTPTL